MRLKPAQIVVIAIALVCGGAAMLLMPDRRGPEPVAQQQVAAPAPQIATVEVLVASTDLPLGKIILPADVTWRRWPEEAGTGSFIVRRKIGRAHV